MLFKSLPAQIFLWPLLEGLSLTDFFVAFSISSECNEYGKELPGEPCAVSHLLSAQLTEPFS